MAVGLVKTCREYYLASIWKALIDIANPACPCTPSLWLETTVPGFGNCFTFNSALGGKPAMNTTLTGNKNGFSLELFIDQSNYMLNKLSTKAGIRLVIHHPFSIPMADEYGMDLQPNTASSVAVQMVVTLPNICIVCSATINDFFC